MTNKGVNTSGPKAEDKGKDLLICLI